MRFVALKRLLGRADLFSPQPPLKKGGSLYCPFFQDFGVHFYGFNAFFSEKQRVGQNKSALAFGGVVITICLID